MASDQTSYEHYYVPHNGWFPVFASAAIWLILFGLGDILRDMVQHVGHPVGIYFMFAGALLMAFTLFNWFSKVIEENQKKLYSHQMNRSYVWGMSWFIFSEVMFFGAFFGALFYVRIFVVDWLGGVGHRGPANILWPNYHPGWPMLHTPNPKLFPGAKEAIFPWGLPLVNTILLVSSSFWVTFAHHGIKEGNRKKLIFWLSLTILFGLSFLCVQTYEYHEAYTHLGLTLHAGIFGTTFFMLTGFHGAHVTLGTFMLIIMLFRAFKGHFEPDDCFGFEAASWYWHFVDVVWLGLFIFVYVLGVY